MYTTAFPRNMMKTGPLCHLAIRHLPRELPFLCCVFCCRSRRHGHWHLADSSTQFSITMSTCPHASQWTTWSQWGAPSSLFLNGPVGGIFKQYRSWWGRLFWGITPHYIYIYVYTHTHMHIHTYIYIYIGDSKEMVLIIKGGVALLRKLWSLSWNALLGVLTLQHMAADHFQAQLNPKGFHWPAERSERLEVNSPTNLASWSTKEIGHGTNTFGKQTGTTGNVGKFVGVAMLHAFQGPTLYGLVVPI